MIKKRYELWVLLFTGVVIHTLISSSLNMAITAMIKRDVSQESTTVSECQVSINLSTSIDGGSSSQEIGEFNWSNNERDTLLSSLSWLMGIASLLGGILCQKLGGKIMFGYANLIAGALSFIIPMAANFGVMWIVAIRVLQGFAGGAGVGNSINYFMSKWVPHNERSKFAATQAGFYVGVGFSNFLNGFILYLLGWRYVFYVTGIISILWTLAWYFCVYNLPEKHPRITINELSTIRSSMGNDVSKKRLPIPWIRILTSIPLMANATCYFANMWITFTYVGYIPTYLRTVHGLSFEELGSYSSLPYMLEFLVAIGFAILMDFIAKRKILSVTNTRKFAAFMNHIIGGILFGIMVFGGCNTTFVLIMFTITISVNGTNVAIYMPNLIDLSPNFCAAINGLLGLIACSAGFISPLVINYYTSHYNDVEAWNKIFIVSMVINIVSGLLFLIFGQSKAQSWNAECANDIKTEEELKEMNKDEER